ncbi:hypothetical protein [Saccharopolyspora hattusasensis]|uniref:hypothetical protein n=1 Tax=Saccharopolyspora hattusasensis TaxID=1128679 RepID=UPI003D967A5D
MGQVNQPSNLLDRIKRAEQQIQRLWKSVGLASATISRGGLTLLQDAFLRMVDDNQTEVLYIGPDNTGKQVLTIRRRLDGRRADHDHIGHRRHCLSAARLLSAPNRLNLTTGEPPMTPADNGVTITLSQMYGEMQAMHGEVREMRTELRAGLATVSDHETRLRTLERKVWAAAGASGVLGAIITALLAAYTKNFGM